MKTARKVLLLVLCAALLVSASVLGTIAYLTDFDTANNTFTVGKVDIELDEAKVTPDGTPVEGAARVTENTYHLLPGHTYTKDPTVTVKAGSEESYIRMLVTVTFTEPLTDAELATKLDEIFVGYDATKWLREVKNVSEDKKTITYEYRYYETVVADTVDTMTGVVSGNDVVLEPLFKQIEVPGTLTNETIATFAGMNINIVAQAIQADGFKTADAAWDAFPAN